MSMEDALKLAIDALKKVLGKEFSLERLDGGVITQANKKFTKIDKDHIKKHFKK